MAALRAALEIGYTHIDTAELYADGHSEELVGQAIREVDAQIAAHFALEEKMMRETHYPHLNEHKEDHETLLDDLRDIMDEVEVDGTFDEQQLANDLNRWFSDHFSTHDAKLHHYGRH